MVYLLVDEVVEKYGKGWIEKYKDENGLQIIEKIFGWPDNNLYVVVKEEKTRKKIQTALEKELEKIRNELRGNVKSIKIKTITTAEYNKEWKGKMRIL